MLHKKTSLYALVFIVTILVVLGGVFAWDAFSPCTEVIKSSPVGGSQGYRIWFGDTLETFEHENKKICIPDGWEAVGEKKKTGEWSKFEDGKTGIFVESDSFSKVHVSPESSNYDVEILLPNAISENTALLYVDLIEQTFNDIGNLFGDRRSQNPIPHTVLVTSGLDADGGTVYPDPHSVVTIVVSDPKSIRGEELFIHAVAHLYNRFSPSFSAYQKRQSPIPPEDFQELEATWAETRFRSSDEGRFRRLAYLYHVHTAVQTKNFSLIIEPPFNNHAEFDAIQPNIIVPKNSSYVNAQYGHYVLGPLAMVALDGLLAEKGLGADVESILVRIHGGEKQGFFDVLAKHLSEEEVREVKRWMFEGKTIPRDLLESALEFYSKK